MSLLSRWKRLEQEHEAEERHRVAILMACRRLGLGKQIYVFDGHEPRFEMNPDPVCRELRRVGWHQLERIGAGEDIEAVLGGKA